MIDFVKTLINKDFPGVIRSYNAYYATNFCSTLWNARYLTKNAQNTNKIYPHPRKMARALTGECYVEQHFHTNREKSVYGI